MTTEEFLLFIDADEYCEGAVYSSSAYSYPLVREMLKTFAKLKVKEALVSAAINATLTWDNKIDKGSILNAYDLNLIK